MHYRPAWTWGNFHTTGSTHALLLSLHTVLGLLMFVTCWGTWREAFLPCPSALWIENNGVSSSLVLRPCLDSWMRWSTEQELLRDTMVW